MKQKEQQLKNNQNNKMYLKTFNQINKKLEKVFQTVSISGLLFQQTVPLNKISHFTTTINFKPTELKVQPRPDGRANLIRFAPNAFYLSYTVEKNGFKFVCSPPTKEALMEMPLSKSLLVRVKYLISDSTLFQFFSSQYSSKYLTLNTQIATQGLSHINLFNIDGNIGTRNFSFLWQTVFARQNKPIGIALSLYASWKRSIGSISTVVEGIPKTFVIRYRRKFTDNFRFGTAFHVGPDLQPELDIGYVYKYKNSTIKSTITSTRIVGTSFEYRLSPTYRFLVSCNLDHIQNQYRSGFAFVWDVPGISN